MISEYELNKDYWVEGYSVMTTIMVKDITDNWKAVSAAVQPDNTYGIVEKYENDILGEFKDSDIVRCDEREGILFAIEKVAD